jgi:hypothetical protein
MAEHRNLAEFILILWCFYSEKKKLSGFPLGWKGKYGAEQCEGRVGYSIRGLEGSACFAFIRQLCSNISVNQLYLFP